MIKRAGHEKSIGGAHCTKTGCARQRGLCNLAHRVAKAIPFITRVIKAMTRKRVSEGNQAVSGSSGTLSYATR